MNEQAMSLGNTEANKNEIDISDTKNAEGTILG